MNKIFKTNPGLKEAHRTSDGQFFYQETDAKNHAKTLTDKTVEHVVNELEMEVIDDEELTPEQIEMAAFEAAEKVKADEAALAAAAEFRMNLAKESLEAFDPETADYQVAVKLFNDLGLESESLKKSVIYPLLAQAKEAQSQQ